ncbi:MAG: ribose 5-phosphate isomerase B [Tissierellales bacterium]|jgi:ribose 5-phosphate isomerase B|nr:ribose 5-phosphate isomerase B [Tissierellales bacterium]
MKIYLGSDHGGFELKEVIEKYLIEEGYEVEDLGTHSEDSVDYPDFGIKVGEAVVKEEDSIGIVFCGTGIGISIAANKVKGVRCALCSNVFSAEMAKKHNNANVIALGGRVTGKDLGKRIVKAFLEEKFEGGRHSRRVNKIMNY